jgi:hypothetical protein
MMLSLSEPARETTVIHKTDVLVVGSGPAGLVAALAATHNMAYCAFAGQGAGVGYGDVRQSWLRSRQHQCLDCTERTDQTGSPSSLNGHAVNTWLLHARGSPDARQK